MNEKLLPIVPGCKALIICASKKYSKCIGKEVTVIGKDYSDPDPSWIISGDAVDFIGGTFGYSITAAEWALMRIDGGSFKHEQHELEVKS